MGMNKRERVHYINGRHFFAAVEFLAREDRWRVTYWRTGSTDAAPFHDEAHSRQSAIDIAHAKLGQLDRLAVHFIRVGESAATRAEASSQATATPGSEATINPNSPSQEDEGVADRIVVEGASIESHGGRVGWGGAITFALGTNWNFHTPEDWWSDCDFPLRLIIEPASAATNTPNTQAEQLLRELVEEVRAAALMTFDANLRNGLKNLVDRYDPAARDYLNAKDGE